MAIDLDKIKVNYPSLCYNCDLARRPASDENIKKGFVGCSIRVQHKPNDDHLEIIHVKEIGEGWVDLRSTVDRDKGSGVITNFQLMTLEVSKCNLYQQK